MKQAAKKACGVELDRVEGVAAARESAHTIRFSMASKSEAVKSFGALLTARVAGLLDGTVGPPRIAMKELQKIAALGREMERRHRVRYP